MTIGGAVPALSVWPVQTVKVPTRAVVAGIDAGSRFQVSVSLPSRA